MPPNLEQPAVGHARRGRGPGAALDERDLAQEPARRHRPNRPITVLHANGALDDHKERLPGLALEDEDVAGLRLDRVGEDRDRLEAAVVETGEEGHTAERRKPIVHRGEDSDGPPADGILGRWVD